MDCALEFRCVYASIARKQTNHKHAGYKKDQPMTDNATKPELHKIWWEYLRKYPIVKYGGILLFIVFIVAALQPDQPATTDKIAVYRSDGEIVSLFNKDVMAIMKQADLALDTYKNTAKAISNTISTGRRSALEVKVEFYEAAKSYRRQIFSLQDKISGLETPRLSSAEAKDELSNIKMAMLNFIGSEIQWAEKMMEMADAVNISPAQFSAAKSLREMSDTMHNQALARAVFIYGKLGYDMDDVDADAVTLKPDAKPQSKNN